MSTDHVDGWERTDMTLAERATFLLAWARNDIRPSGGLFRTGMGGFRTSSRVQPFLSNVLGRGEHANELLGHILDAHPKSAPSVLLALADHANSAKLELMEVGKITAPPQAKQMIAAMLRYSSSLAELVEGTNREVVDDLKAGLAIRVAQELCVDDISIKWLAACVEIATGVHPNHGLLPASRKIIELLLSSIRKGCLDDALSSSSVDLAPLPPQTGESDWQCVARGDDEEIESSLISWANQRDAWYESGLHEKFSFMEDVLEHTSANVDTESDEDQPPGRSFVVHEVYINSPIGFREELCARIRKLAALDLREVQDGE